MDRNKEIIKVSIFGIIVNLILVAFKAVIGIIVNSIAIILDAVNNLSDALSSIITIIGTKLSNKKPDKKHPYGHGRIEYFSSVIIAIIVLIAGVTAFKEIIHPEAAEYSIVSLIIVMVAVFVKFFFGRYVKKQGKKLNSGSLVASGTDALSDSILSLSTFIAAVISIIWHISLEGYLGVIISIFILKSAIDILKEAIDDMIGTRADPELTQKLREFINSYEDVLGVYDIIIHNYGPNKIIASVHIQVDDNITAKEIHKITRRIIVDVYNKFGIILTMGIYASNDTGKYKEIKEYIGSIIKDYKYIIQMHGFYVDEEDNAISFDLIFDFDELEPQKKIEEIVQKLKNKYPEYSFNIILDTDISD